MIQNGMRPIHPGEILREDYLAPLGLSVNALAHALGSRPPGYTRLSRKDAPSRLTRHFA